MVLASMIGSTSFAQDIYKTAANVPMVQLNNGILMPQFGLRCVPLLRRIGQRPDQERTHEAGHKRCVRYPFALYGDLYGQTAGNESLG